MDDESEVPAHCEGYEQPHTREWSREVKETDAFVFVTPQYNGSIPAPLKNALDHLYPEWEGKPALIVTYGGSGGTKCAEHLRQVAVGMKMRPTVTAPALTLPKPVLAEGAPLEPETAFAGSADMVRKGFGELVAMLETVEA